MLPELQLIIDLIPKGYWLYLTNQENEFECLLDENDRELSLEKFKFIN